MRFAVERAGDSPYVVPSDVAGLVKAGYHDHERDSLPLIVQYGTGSSARVTASGTLSTAGARVARELPAVGGAGHGRWATAPPRKRSRS